MRTTRHTMGTVVVAAVATIAMLGLGGVADASSPADGQNRDFVLDRDRRGEDAISRLGDRLPVVAAENGMTPGEFQQALRDESQLWVGRTGQLLFVDEVVAPSDGPEAPPLADHPLSDTFLLHSRPNADRTIYLDFDGHDASGTAWDTGSNNTQAAPYSKDSDPAFNDTERAVIQDVWKRISEDFAPFNVDVTTEEPPADRLLRATSGDQEYGTRLAITPTYVYGCSCGGVSYVGHFDDVNSTHYQPSWVFTGGVGTGAKNIAEAGSHELGHMLGLHHDGKDSTSYYYGHGDWAPIMGVGYSRPITQWSKGEYSGATQTQDDLIVMQANGIPIMADDHGNDAASAQPIVDADFQELGLIHNRSDVDVFSFDVGAGTVIINADPAPSSPNLDIGLTVRNAAGNTIGTVLETGSEGLGASVTTVVTAGTYTIEIDGVGSGTASNGYTDYASLGRYVLSGTLPSGEEPPPPPPPNQAPTANAATVGASSGDAPFTVQLTGNGSSDPDGDTLSYSWKDGSTTFSSSSNASRTFLAAGSYELVLTVDDGEYTDTDSVTITVTDAEPPPPPVVTPAKPSGATATQEGSDVVITWNDTSNNENNFQIYRERLHKNGSWRGTTLVGTVDADMTTFTDLAPTLNEYRYLVRAVNTAGSSDFSITDNIDVVDSGTPPDDGGGDGGGGGGNGKGRKPPKK